jgi:hypothetical protein
LFNNEIESVNAEIEGTDFDKQKQTQERRCFIHKYITNTLSTTPLVNSVPRKTRTGIIDEEYAKGRKNRQATTIIKLDQQLKDYREWLLELTICDPGLWFGAFLNQALDFLIENTPT